MLLYVKHGPDFSIRKHNLKFNPVYLLWTTDSLYYFTEVSTLPGLLFSNRKLFTVWPAGWWTARKQASVCLNGRVVFLQPAAHPPATWRGNQSTALLWCMESHSNHGKDLQFEVKADLLTWNTDYKNNSTHEASNSEITFHWIIKRLNYILTSFWLQTSTKRQRAWMKCVISHNAPTEFQTGSVESKSRRRHICLHNYAPHFWVPLRRKSFFLRS